jgi:hypothetical protein
MNWRSKSLWQSASLFIAVATGTISLALATPLWLNASRLPDWTKLFLISRGVGACGIPLMVRTRPQNVPALWISVALTTICMASLFFSLFVYVPALVTMLIAAELATNHAKRRQH